MDSLGQLSARDSGTHRSVAAVLDVVLVVDCRIVHLLLAHTVHLIATLVQAVEASELTFVCKTSTRIWVVVVLWVLVRKPFHFLCEAAMERENQRANQSANKSPARHDAITLHTTCGALHNGSSACALKQSCCVHTEQTRAFTDVAFTLTRSTRADATTLTHASLLGRLHHNQLFLLRARLLVLDDLLGWAVHSRDVLDVVLLSCAPTVLALLAPKVKLESVER
jgi:hypothetical protein